MGKEKSLQQKAQLALNDAVFDVKVRHLHTGRPIAIWKNGKTVMKKPEGERILKYGKEFIISKYSAHRYFVAVVDQNGNIVPKFPFDTLEEAKRWVERQQK